MKKQYQKTPYQDLMQSISAYEIHYLKQQLSANTKANILLLGEDLPELWNRHEWHGILSIHEQCITQLNIPQIKAHHHELPLLADSIDFIVLYHALDFAPKTKLILRELWRVLAPEGKIIILGYNPKALFGLPTTIIKQPLATHDLIKQVKRQGFSQEFYQTFCFYPPLKKIKLLNKLPILEMIGKCCWPYWGMIYLLVANKPLLPLTPIKNKKQKKPKLHFAMKGLAAPTHRSRLS